MDKITTHLNNIINEYANKPLDDAYHLDSGSLPHNELLSLIDIMIRSDTSLRDTVLNHIQESIDAQIPHFEVEHRYWQ